MSAAHRRSCSFIYINIKSFLVCLADKIKIFSILNPLFFKNYTPIETNDKYMHALNNNY